MNIAALAHVLRASRALTGETVFVIVGSQAILAQFPEAPGTLLHSSEIDIYPRDKPDLAEVIEGALGADSSFHGTFGYHADGVGPETAQLPKGWVDRAVELRGHPLLEGSEAIAPEAHDLAASKIAVFRDKDRSWVRAAIEADIVDPAILLERLKDMGDIPSEVVTWVGRWIDGPPEP